MANPPKKNADGRFVDHWPTTRKSTTICDFLWQFARIQGELAGNRLAVDKTPDTIYLRLLLYFTPSELEERGLPQRLGIVTPHYQRSIWGAIQSDSDYYTSRHLEFPSDFPQPA